VISESRSGAWFLMHIKEMGRSLRHYPFDRTMPRRADARAPCEGVGTMTILMITVWLALQIPAGTLLGRMLQRGLIFVPVAARRGR
jgi:hypothetical protein